MYTSTAHVHLLPFLIYFIASSNAISIGKFESRGRVATGISARCRPDAMNEKFRKDDTRLHGMCYGAI